MKGIVLAGGTGSRLWPITKGVSKQLLPVFDKPLIHYPIATLMLAGIRDICIITTPQDQNNFKSALGDGSSLGINFNYLIQENPGGLAQAFTISEDFINREKCALILGDNLFHGSGLGSHLADYNDVNGAQIFAYKVSDPQRYGVVSFDENGKANSVEEKPKEPKSSFAITGLYFYDNQVVEIAKNVKPSKRGEVEITSVNEAYLNINQLNVSILPRGTAWMDTGTFESLHEAGSYIKAIQLRQGSKISCLEEIAFRKKWITESQLEKLIDDYRRTEYAIYLTELLENKI
jgi:glucose-1-phosphate thymidylyltransferase